MAFEKYKSWELFSEFYGIMITGKIFTSAGLSLKQYNSLVVGVIETPERRILFCYFF